MDQKKIARLMTLSKKKKKKKKNQFFTLRETKTKFFIKLETLNSLNFPALQETPKSNLSKLEPAAIYDLKNGNNIEIKEVD